MLERKIYIGDSVYAHFDGLSVTLTTENGMGAPTNIIVLEPMVMVALLEVWKRWTDERDAGRTF